MSDRYLLDTNILVYLADPANKMHRDCDDAVKALLNRGDELFIVPQNIYEFWAVATRSASLKNAGLGFTASQCLTQVARLENIAQLLDDSAEIYGQWKRLVTTYGAQGKMAHDARLAAAMKAHDLSHILTANAKDFRRFEPEGISIVEPVSI
jgi:predicted nucleic acid-binding protein